MLKVYIGQNKETANIPVLLPNLSFQIKESWIFIKDAFKDYKEPVLDLTDDPETADFLMIPFNYFNVKDNHSLLKRFIDLSRKYSKKIIVFAYGDRDDAVEIPNSIIFRTSQYGYKKRKNEIMMPGYTEDLVAGRALELREKGDFPVVGFCGWADFKDLKLKIKYLVKLTLSSFGKSAERKGLYFRRRALAILSECSKIKTNFLIRRSYSGHAKTIELAPEKARAEYISNIIDSDFVLTVKGDGNFSYRFYEALSLGRIPLFINTDCVLPLENIIDYKKFVLFVDHKNIDRIGNIVFDYYAGLSGEEFKNKQKMAREAFEKYLRIDRYFDFMFRQEKIIDFIVNGN